MFTTIVCRAAGLGVGSYVRSVHRVAEVAAAMGLIALEARILLAGAPDTARLAAVVLTGAVSYVALLRWREPGLVGEVAPVVRRRGA